MPKQLDLLEILNPNTPLMEIKESKEILGALLAY
jgi:hypothetical protein